ncbi:DSBA oxidoreductase [Streptomyces albiflavescens]|uniref:DSBA oxidoreductase n=1 Tax=Streptomyces albiflavescens TaxID=1623582 RepID=A0A917Y641_9ACTN|nr:DsbA family oxidoreductase [Streptomyces albiflavescens]GGN72537.1 DSBA oxidoreductase [Streptomyces albiflavescens]
MVNLDVFSDLICPWCYIGGRRLQKAVDIVQERTGLEFRIRHHAFELNPTMPVAGMDRRAYRSEKFGSWERSRQLDAGTVLAGRDEGLVFDYEAIARTPNTRAGHRLIALAERESGQGAAMADRLLVAYFSEGQDVGDIAVLARLGEESGLGDDVAARLEDPALETAVREDEQLAEYLGLRGVPLLIVGDEAINGAVTTEALVEILERHATQVPDGAACEDGVCSP